MAYNFTRKTYPNGVPRSGPEMSEQERRIEDAIGSLEGPDGYVPGDSIADVRNEVNAIKGTSGDPPINLVTVEEEIHYGHNIGHTHDSTSITSLPFHTHPHEQIDGLEDNYAGKDEVGSIRLLVSTLDAQVRLVITDFGDLRGDGWVGGESVHEAMQLARYHIHSASDISGIENYVTQSQFNQLTGSPWSTDENVHEIWTRLTSGENPGHSHTKDAISDFGDLVTQEQLNVVKGGGYDPLTMSVYENFITIRDEVKGQGHENFMTLKWMYDNIQNLWSHDSTHEGQIFDISSRLAESRGEDYNNAVKRVTSKITGVILSYPNGGGTLKGTYNFNFIRNGGGTGIHQMIWAGGTAVNITTAKSYTLYDNTSSNYIIATVISLSSLPASSLNDVVKIVPQNIADLYDKWESILTTESVTLHAQQVHADTLVNVGTFSVSGFTLTYGNLQFNIDGVLFPDDASVYSGEEDFDQIDANGTPLSSTQAKVDAFVFNTSTQLFEVVKGVAFDIDEGISSYPSISAGKHLVLYMYIGGNYSELRDDDIILAHTDLEWKARWALISDAIDAHGTSVDEKYGYTITQPYNIEGVKLTLHRIIEINQPTAITGVSLSELADSTAKKGYYGTTGQGDHTLVFTLSGQTLSWNGGSAQAVGAGGTFTLTGSDGTQIRATVTVPSLPLADTTETISFGLRPIPATGRYAVSYNAASGLFVFNGGTGVQINIAGGGTYYVADANGYYISVVVDDDMALPRSSVTDKVRVVWNGFTELDMKIEDIIDSINNYHIRSLTGTFSRTFNIGELESDGWMALIFGNSVRNKYLGIDTSADSFQMNGHLALTAPHSYRVYRQNSTYHELFGQDWQYYQGTDFASHDSSATPGTISSGMLRDGQNWYGYLNFINPVFQTSEYQFIRVFMLPFDFAEFADTGAEASQPGLRLNIATESTDKFKNKVSVIVHKEGSSNVVTQVLDQTSSVANGVTQIDIASSSLVAANFTKGDKLIVYVKAYSKEGLSVKLLDAKLTFRTIPQD